MSVTVKTSELIPLFKKAYIEKWGYIWGGAGEVWTQAKQNAATRDMTKQYGQKWVGKRVADCSGLFYWAYKQLGSYMYHGSNTMYKQYSASSGELNNGARADGKELKPGTAVYKYNNADGYYHVGLYIGNGEVIEAQGTKTGVVKSTVKGWTHWAELKYTEYDGAGEDKPAKPEEVAKMDMIVKTGNGGGANLRAKESTASTLVMKMPEGALVGVISRNEDWAKVTYAGKTGYVMCKYIVDVDGQLSIEERLDRLEKLAREAGWKI